MTMPIDPESAIGDARLIELEALVRSCRRRVHTAALYMNGPDREQYLTRQVQRLVRAKQQHSAHLDMLASRRSFNQARESEREREDQARQRGAQG